MPLVGTISGSNGTVKTAVTGTLVIANTTSANFPQISTNVTLYVSGTKTSIGADDPSIIFAGDAFTSGAMGTDSYFQMKPVNTLRIPTNTTASYIYTSGSTNDMYFTQYNGPYTNTIRLRWLESQIQTGLHYGGVISSTSGSATYNISSGSGIIVTQNASLSDDPYPTIVHVDWGNLTGLTLPSISTTQITYVALDSTATPYLKSTPFVAGDYSRYIVLGRVLHTDKIGTNGTVNQPQVSYGTNQYRGDFIRAFGPIKLSGHTFYASGSLGLKKDAGDSYAEGRNYTVDPENPNYISSTSDTAQNTSKIFYEYVNSTGDDVILNNGNLGYAVVDFEKYNNSGTLTAVGAGNKFTIQRVYWFPNATNRAFFVYYGNTIYATITDAQDGIASEVFTEGKNTRDAAIFLGYLIVKGVGTNFTDPTTYKIIQAGSFRAVASSGAAPSGTPGGENTQVQFNDAGVFNGDSGLTFNKTTDTLSVAGGLNVTGSLSASGSLTFSFSNTGSIGAGAYSNFTFGNQSFIGVDTRVNSYTGTLPSITSTTVGKTYFVKDIGGFCATNNFVITSSSPNKIDGATELKIQATSGSVMLVSGYDPTDVAYNWYIMSIS